MDAQRTGLGWREYTRPQRCLEQRLRQLRQALSSYDDLPVYRIFTNRTLEALVLLQPRSLIELKAIPGLGDYKCNRYGGTILLCIERSLRQTQENWISEAQKRSAKPAQQMVKALFESGAASHEIAQRRGIKQSSVVRSLEYLQNAGQIDTCSWVEEQLPPQSLRKGKAYFQDRPQSSLRAAYESLGLDYDSLRMCRMYVSSLKTRID